MPKKAHELGPLAVTKLSKSGLHFVGGVAGLALQMSTTGARSWILRINVGGRRRDMGLGGFPDVTLSGARQAARDARQQVKAGRDPIEEAKTARNKLLLANAKTLTFAQCADAYIAAHQNSWKNAKHRLQWQTTLDTYAHPEIGNLAINRVALPHILNILQPIWLVKTETASRLRGRMESILDWATTHQYREGLNPARWKGHLAVLLPPPNKIRNEKHHTALPIIEIAAFMSQLRMQSGVGAKALEFAILTAARSGEVRGAAWEEIDHDGAVWTVPAHRMKGRKEHRVPLSGAALKLLGRTANDQLNGLAYGQVKNLKGIVFSAPSGRTLSDMTLSGVMRRMKVAAVPHGFRSTFRDWCSEHTNHSREVAEMALAHVLENKVEAAYRRGDLFEKRRRLMEDWAEFCDGLTETAT